MEDSFLSAKSGYDIGMALQKAFHFNRSWGQPAQGQHCIFQIRCSLSPSSHFSLERFYFRSILTIHLPPQSVPISNVKIINKKTSYTFLLEFNTTWKKWKWMTPFHYPITAWLPAGLAAHAVFVGTAQYCSLKKKKLKNSLRPLS